MPIARRIRMQLPLLMLAGGLAACGQAPTPAVDETLVAETSPGLPPVSWEQFRASAYKEPWPGGHFLVDGDIPLRDEAALRAYYDSWTDEREALTVDQVLGTDNVWPLPGRLTLTYCIGSSTGAHKAAVQDAMAIATRSWSDLAGVQFTYLPGEDASCTNSNSNVTFDVQEVPQDNNFAGSFFPSDPRDFRSLNIRPSAYTTTSGGRDFQGILRHELGHTLGFRHEHIWLSPPCTAETATNARHVTPYDVNSVMHYPQCRPSGTGGYRQTNSDFTGAISLYGLSALLIGVITS